MTYDESTVFSLDGYPEFLCLFSHTKDNENDIEVEVRYSNGRKVPISERYMQPSHIMQLIHPMQNKFYSEMRFDDYLFEVFKYHIDPILNRLTIMVRDHHFVDRTNTNIDEENDN